MTPIQNEQERSTDLPAIAMFITVGALLLCIAGCSTEKKVNDWAIKNPDKFKTLAAIIAPCVDVNPKSDTVYQSHTDTLITDGRTDTVRRNDTVYITKQLPGKTIYKRDVQTVTKTVADSRMLDACAIKSRGIEEELIIAQTELKQKTEAKNTWMWIAIGCMAAIAIFTVIKAYTFIKGGALKSLLK